MTYKPPKLWDLAATARRFKVNKDWLRAEAEAGRVPALKAGDRYVFDPDAVEQVLLDRARKAVRDE